MGNFTRMCVIAVYQPMYRNVNKALLGRLCLHRSWKRRDSESKKTEIEMYKKHMVFSSLFTCNNLSRTRSLTHTHTDSNSHTLTERGAHTNTHTLFWRFLVETGHTHALRAEKTLCKCVTKIGYIKEQVHIADGWSICTASWNLSSKKLK